MTAEINLIDEMKRVMDTNYDQRRRIGKFRSILGPDVILIRKPINPWGDSVSEVLPAFIAVEKLLDDPDNGTKYASGIIDWCGAPSWDWDKSP